MADDPGFFAPGEIVYLRHFQHQAVSGLFPLRVVRHDVHGLLLWGTHGGRSWHLNMPDGRRMLDTPLAEWVTTRKVAATHSVHHSLLSWHPTGVDYSIRFFFAPDGRFRNWYANLEIPVVCWRDETLAGADTVDWDLDVWIEPDRSWRWKDEQEFVERLRSPAYYWVDDEDRVRAAGHEVVKLVEAGAFPFDGTWCDFQPDPAWTAIADEELPPGWDRPRAC